MRRKTAILVLASAAVAACGYTPHDLADRGVESVHEPIVTAANYVFDAAAPGGQLAPGEPERLNAWLQGLEVGYGDSIYVDGANSEVAREQVAGLVSVYGMPVLPGAPITAGALQPGSVRVVVARRRAEVSGCPDWHRASNTDFQNRSMSNYGCAVNSNLAAMVANPEDLIHGQQGSGLADATTSTRAVQFYRTAPPSGTKGLQEISTSKKDSQ